jgi:Ca-activated chloride channel family protein
MGFFGGCEGISCETHIGDGLAMAIDMAVSIVNKKKFVVFMSDGANTGGAVSPDDAINYAKINDVQVFVIGIGKDKVDAHGRVLLDEPLLKKIAMETKGKYFNAIDDKSLEAIYESINEDIEREKELVNVKDLFFAGSFVILTLFLFFVYVKFRIIV